MGPVPGPMWQRRAPFPLRPNPLLLTLGNSAAVVLQDRSSAVESWVANLSSRIQCVLGADAADDRRPGRIEEVIRALVPECGGVFLAQLPEVSDATDSSGRAGPPLPLPPAAL